jgi:hypothetical protein
MYPGFSIGVNQARKVDGWIVVEIRSEDMTRHDPSYTPQKGTTK